MTTKWLRTPFGQFAESVTERVDDPSSAGVERYVGLEHLDPGSLRIKRWGHPSDVEATKLRFQPGDVIFGRRRAYQRKLAQANFAGICSAHALVLRARPSIVLPEFLPYLMRTDAFFERALAISVGSLSPTINWRTLAREHFSVPPLDEQRHIASVLSAETAAAEKFEDAIATARTVRRSLAAANFQRALSGDDVRQLGELLTRCQY
ncbi:MAG: restriction endonuclease subunit S, partial [Solirubrobacteraceae bacterium]